MRSGTWFLEGRTAKERRLLKESPDYEWLDRFPKLHTHLAALIEDCRERYGCHPIVAYEKVMSHGLAGVNAAHTYGGWLSCFGMLNCAYRRQVRFVPIHVGTWKKVFVGNGHAKQREYVDAANQHFNLDLTVTYGQDEAAALGIGVTAIDRIQNEQIEKA